MTKLLAVLVGSLCAAAAQAEVLQGDYLKVGVAESGALITQSGFSTVGLFYDPTGHGGFTGPDLLGLSPFAFYSVGKDSVTGSYLQGSPNVNQMLASTTGSCNSSGCSADTNGTSFIDGIKFTQAMSFDKAGSTIHYTVTLNNTGSSMLTGVAFATGLDPDLPAENTHNVVSGESVSASSSQYRITLADTSSSFSAHASTSASGDTSPYWLQTAPTATNDQDWQIALAYNFGDLAAGQSKSITYDLTVSAVPEPETYAMMMAGLAMLGALGRRRRPS